LPVGLSVNIQQRRGHTNGVHSTEPSQDRMP
jgi:hypothetical protein